MHSSLINRCINNASIGGTYPGSEPGVFADVAYFIQTITPPPPRVFEVHTNVGVGAGAIKRSAAICYAIWLEESSGCLPPGRPPKRPS